MPCARESEPNLEYKKWSDALALCAVFVLQLSRARKLSFVHQHRYRLYPHFQTGERNTACSVYSSEEKLRNAKDTRRLAWGKQRGIAADSLQRVDPRETRAEVPYIHLSACVFVFFSCYFALRCAKWWRKRKTCISVYYQLFAYERAIYSRVLLVENKLKSIRAKKKTDRQTHTHDISRDNCISWTTPRTEAAILERKRESGVPLFCVPRQRRSSQPENVSDIRHS